MIKSLMSCLLAATCFFFSCKKSGNSGPAPSSQTAWTISGATFYGETTLFGTDTVLLSLESADSLGNNVDIAFHARPVTNGKYSVVLENATSSQLGVNQCEVFALIVNNGNNFYGSSGKSGNVSVTIAYGKITAVLSNINMENINDPQDTTTVSGTLHEQ